MRSRSLGALAAASMLAALCALPATAAAAAEGPVARLAVTLGEGARPAQPTALDVALRIDLRRQPSPLTAVALRYPAALGVTTSGLGIEPCRRSASEFAAVVIPLTSSPACPRNSVMGVGEAIGEIRMDGEPVSREVGEISVHSGPLVGDRLQLVALVDGHNPIGARLAYAGEVRPAPKPYGGELSLTINPLPDEWRATVALSKLDLAIGSSKIVYHDRSGGRLTRYSPDGVLLPSRCPTGGFPFMAAFRFADGRTSVTRARARCPR